MPTFAYKIIDSSGRQRSSKIEAGNEIQARATLRNRGMHVVQLHMVAGGSGSGAERSRKISGRVPIDEQAIIFRQLAILIRAGISLTDALYGLKDQSKNQALKQCLESIHTDVVEGASFSEAVARYPKIFPKLVSDMISVAEAGGTLYEALDRLANHMEASADIVRKIKAATSYPMVVLMISAITVIAMVTFILPRFLKLFKQMGVTLPWTTKLLLLLSKSCTEYWYLWIGITAIFIAGVRYAISSPQTKPMIDKLILKAPITGELATKIIVTRSMKTLGTLLKTGVQMLVALETAGAAANNTVVQSALKQAQLDVSSGASITNSLKKSGVFPPLVIQMVSAGEKSGELPEMLEHACEHYSKDIDGQLKSLTSIIEPIMIVVLGAVVGFIALSIIVPIYSLVGGVK